MIESRTNRRGLSPNARRARRRAEGLVAEYIHQLSDRHAGARRRAGAPGPRPATATAEASR